MRTGSAMAKRGDMYGNGLSGRKRTARRGGRRTVLHERTGLRVAIQQANCAAQENWIAGGNSAGKLYCTGELDCRWQFSRQAVVIREDLVAPE